MAKALSLWAHIPTALTLLRIALVAPIWLALFVPVQLGYATALSLFVIAALTDLVDGWLARKLDAVTKLGAALDALADKILVVGVLAALASHHRLDAIAFMAFTIIAAREGLVAIWRLRVLQGGRAVAANIAAKSKTVCQMAGVAALLATPFAAALGPIGDWLLVAGAALGLISAAQYLVGLGQRQPKP
jgi:CDP-diacylglycerol---glycerol-3-phosphate 3-phosphatidyltransferase